MVSVKEEIKVTYKENGGSGGKISNSVSMASEALNTLLWTPQIRY